MSSILRYSSIALVAATLIGCSGEADVDVDTGDETTSGTSEEMSSGDSLGRSMTTTPGAGDSLGAPAQQGTMERPVISTEEQERIDDWLAAYADSLNDYGDPKGTMYAGGTPLFNEAQGKPITKYEYIAAKHPERPWNKPLPEGQPVKREETKEGGADANSGTKAESKSDAKPPEKPSGK
jgi:hypothetical protein